ncbi:glycosyltransferase family 1 protein [Flavobacterium sp. ov086]|uniref:glycosyltransferase family 4 protein n=1 Tax=Flavobacterium sp. ov086 TaxID=1761785 RepID=UPI000B67280D|nr:glycosyltransferase family 1 protein [Flavobacterium sp. ov086]SNR87940.1 Glycosyltransferase involved in cell wall bisynthesis [Flavobacterium sp. ov086]
MKLIIDIRLINASGIGTYLKNVIPGILQAFDEVSVLGNIQEIQLFDWSKSVEIIEFNTKIYSIKEQIQYPFIIPKCDILWCPFFNVPLFSVRANKIVTTIHDVYHLTDGASISFLKKKYAKLLFNNAVKKSSLILTISEFSKKEILKFTKADSQNIALVYCGVKRSFFENPKSGNNLKLPENYILYVGNIKPHKNLIVLLQAYATFSEEFKAKHPLVFIGKRDGFITQDNTIQNFIDLNHLQKHITFTGYVNDSEIPEIYKKATLFVFPSLYEGFGLPILEAFATRTKVISSNAASLPEVGGNAAVYFDPKDYIQLGKIIKRNIEDSSNNEYLFAQGELQLEKFTWEKSIEKHLIAFKKLE